ncbi:MAG TPA: hypothetical protein VFE32_17405 [Puia sp.]|jgi:hypothetical protein|nr:hypothetical protein [Puia sp.]
MSDILQDTITRLSVLRDKLQAKADQIRSVNGYKNDGDVIEVIDAWYLVKNRVEALSSLQTSIEIARENLEKGIPDPDIEQRVKDRLQRDLDQVAGTIKGSKRAENAGNKVLKEYDEKYPNDRSRKPDAAKQDTPAEKQPDQPEKPAKPEKQPHQQADSEAKKQDAQPNEDQKSTDSFNSAKGQETIDELLSTIQKAVDSFQEAIPAIQQDAYNEIVRLVKELDLKNGRLSATVKNVKAIGQLRADLEKVIISDPYVKKVEEFADAFAAVAKLQNKYFSTVAAEFTPPKVLEVVKTQAIEATIDGLTAAGLHASVMSGVQDILRTNITTGGDFPQLMSQMRDYIVGTPGMGGAMVRYTQQITTDALNQFSAQYNQVVTDDLGLEWFQYVGSLIKTSRPLCKALIQKKYVHKSEFEAVIEGDFPEFKEQGGKIDKRTNLPQGMIPGTNKYNFPIYRGGYNCGHQLIAVATSAVPPMVRTKITI